MASAWCGASSHTNDAPGTSHSRACASRYSIASQPGRPRHQRTARLVPGHFVGEVADFVLGDVRRVRHDQLEPAPQLVGQRIEPGADREPDARAAAQPAMLARATSSASALTSVAHTDDVGKLGVERERDRARAGPEVGNRRRRLGIDQRQTPLALPAQPAPFGFLERDLHYLLGLGARDEHAPIDHEVEPAKRPRAEHVLQGLAADAGARPAATAASGRSGGGWSAIVSHSAAG